MNKTVAAPTSLLEAVKFFSDKDVALDFVVAMRWPAGVACPHCGTTEPSFLKTRRIFKCKGCRKQFSAKVGTIFEDSPIPLGKWLPAIWMLANCKNGISSYELGRALGITQKSAWHMLHRIRLAMHTRTFDKVGGEIEIDETFIGGKARFMPVDRKRRVMMGRRGGHSGKTAVMGVLKRGKKGLSQVKTQIVPNVRKHTLRSLVDLTVEKGSTIYTDQLRSYHTVKEAYDHKVIDHARSYAEGKIHVNSLENFWSLLKRGLRGTYVSVEPFHLFRYLDEQVFRFNNRATKDVARFVNVLREVVGKRLTYEELIGANLKPATT